MATISYLSRQFTLKIFSSMLSGCKVVGYSRQCHSIFRNAYIPNTCNLNSVCTLFLRVGYHRIRHYSTDTDKIHSQKILETFPQKKSSDTSDQNKSEDEEERLKRESSWRTMKITLIAVASTISLCGAYIIFTFGSPNRNEEGMIEEDEFSRFPIIMQYLKRAYKSMIFYTKLIQEPSRKELLPDPLQHPYIQPPYTLVLELTDLLVHPEWTYNTGWRFKKRPGMDQFLEQVAPPLFEIVVYTAEQGMIAFPIINSLDPNGYIMYRLFRDATDYIDGHHVKNLDCLNRDLKRVIVVDWNPNSVKLHRANTFLIPRWNGEDSDTSLIDLGSFLRTIATNEIDDVRDVLVHYSQFDDPLQTFKEKQRMLMEEMKKDNERKKNIAPLSPWKICWLRHDLDGHAYTWRKMYDDFLQPRLVLTAPSE